MSADMAVELKGTGVTCLTLYPGAVMTEMINDMISNPENVSWKLTQVQQSAVNPKSEPRGLYLISACRRVHKP